MVEMRPFGGGDMIKEVQGYVIYNEPPMVEEDLEL